MYYSKNLSRILQLKSRLPIKLIKINLHISLDNQRKCTFELFKKDCRKTWNTINEVLKSKNKKHMVNDKFTTSEGTSITDKNEIVEQFNKYFTNIGSSLNSKLPKTGEDPIQHIKHNTASFFCAPTDPTEIINIVKSGNSSKSSGVDNIDPYVVQKIIPQIANQLAHIFNKSLQTGIVPDKLKIAKVIPYCIKMITLNSSKVIDQFQSFHASQK